MLHFIHTADWHLGHTLHGHSRETEHRLFLEWLLASLGEQPVDALIIAGDIFDSANPSAASLSLFYDFLARLHGQMPSMQTIVVAGNHDSGPRLTAPAALLARLGVRVVGTLPPEEEWQETLLIPLRNGAGEVEAWCGAVPFLRVGDLPAVEADDPLVAGIGQVYSRVWQALQKHRQQGQGVVLTGHCYMVGGVVSEMSERKILLGNQHALPVEVFSAEATYMALGHLHLAQRVGKREHVRYSGSPLPLSMGERGYTHQVLRVTLAGSTLVEVAALPVPRAVAMKRIPEQGVLPLAEVLTQLAALPPEEADSSSPSFSPSPFLEIAVAGESAESGLRRRVEEALEGKAVRLVKLGVHYRGVGGGLPTQPAALPELVPEEVFKRRYQQRYQTEPPPPWLAAFHELQEQVEQQETP